MLKNWRFVRQTASFVVIFSFLCVYLGIGVSSLKAQELKQKSGLFEKFNKIPMPDHPDLTEENIKSIVAYIKSETKSVTEDKAPFKKPSKKMLNYSPLSISNDYGYFISFFISVFILIGALLFAVHVRNLK